MTVTFRRTLRFRRLASAPTQRPLLVEEPALPELATPFAILYGPDDRLRTWLRAGQAFAAGCLAAASLGVSIRPLTDAIENVGTRENIRQFATRAGLSRPDHASRPAHHRADGVAGGRCPGPSFRWAPQVGSFRTVCSVLAGTRS